MTNVILCGGSGTRLWPLSRKKRPKQFFPLIQGRTLFEEAILRNKSLCQNFLIVAGADQINLAREQLKNSDIKTWQEILEPMGRNTAPAIALACFALPENELVLVTPSDHTIKDLKAYTDGVNKGMVKANEGCLVTFGIKPLSPETGLGYIETDGTKVVSFREKPDLETAKTYLETGRYLWNSGIFLFKAGVFLNELKVLAPEIYDASLKAFTNIEKASSLVVSKQDMADIPAKSIDYAVMEKSARVAVIPCDMGWSDLGTIESIAEYFEKDENLNTSLLPIDPYYYNACNNFVVTEKKKKIVVVDLQGLVIIDTEEVLLIKKKDSKVNMSHIIEKIDNGNYQ